MNGKPDSCLPCRSRHNVGCRHGRHGLISGSRQADDEGRASAVLVVVTEHLSAMIAHDAIADTQAQSSAFAHLLGSEKGIKNAVRVQDAGAIVAHDDLAEAVALLRGDLNASA